MEKSFSLFTAAPSIVDDEDLNRAIPRRKPWQPGPLHTSTISTSQRHPEGERRAQPERRRLLRGH
eukprot:17048-Prymnesium_polylepis.1